MTTKHILTLVLLCATGGWCHAQDSTTWTLRRCIDHALQHNITIKQKQLEQQGAELDLDNARNNRLPNLSAAAGANVNFGRSETQQNIIVDNSALNTSFTVGATMPLFMGFKIKNEVKARELDFKAATESLNKAKENLELNMASYYLDVLFKQQVLHVYRQQVQLSQEQVQRATMLVEAGRLPMAELYTAKAQQAKDELNVVTATNNLSMSVLSLSQALELPTAEGLQVVEPDMQALLQEGKALDNPAQVFDYAVNGRPHIKEAQYRLQSSMQSLKVAQSAYWPQLNLAVSYGNGYFFDFVDMGNNTGFVNQVNRNHRESVGVNLTVPIFNRFHTRNQVKQARLTISNSEFALENSKKALYKEIQQAYTDATGAKERYLAAQKSMDAAQESFGYQQERYQAGKGTAIEFDEAKTRLAASQSEQLQAMFEYVFRTKILDFYKGEPIDL